MHPEHIFSVRKERKLNFDLEISSSQGYIPALISGNTPLSLRAR
jgi:hypothetical protein